MLALLLVIMIFIITIAVASPVVTVAVKVLVMPIIIAIAIPLAVSSSNNNIENDTYVFCIIIDHKSPVSAPKREHSTQKTGEKTGRQAKNSQKVDKELKLIYPN